MSGVLLHQASQFSHKNYHFNYIQVIKLICMLFQTGVSLPVDRADKEEHRSQFLQSITFTYL